MTRSIFDPTNPGVEHDGDRNMLPRAQGVFPPPTELIEAQPDEEDEQVDFGLVNAARPQSLQQTLAAEAARSQKKA